MMCRGRAARPRSNHSPAGAYRGRDLPLGAQDASFRRFAEDWHLEAGGKPPGSSACRASERRRDLRAAFWNESGQDGSDCSATPSPAHLKRQHGHADELYMNYILDFTTTTEQDAAKLHLYLNLKLAGGVSRRGLVISTEVNGESDERDARQLVRGLGLEGTTAWRRP